MLPTTVLFVIATALGLGNAAAVPESIDPSLEKRRCFKTGIKYGQQSRAAQDRAEEACKNGVFNGNWKKGQSVSKCYNIGGNKHVKFTISLTGPNAPKSRYLGSSECFGGLSSEITSCERGGQTTYGRWYYRADPNDGPC